MDSRQRVVILPGPHKTGTSSVQRYISDLQEENLLHNWSWPGQRDKSFANLANSLLFDANDKDGWQRRKHDKIAKAWSQGNSIVIGAELLDYVGAMTKEEDVLKVFRRMQTLLPPNVSKAEAVIMYRTPRSSHLVSAWKQQLAMAKKERKFEPWRFQLDKNTDRSKKTKAPSLAEWLCHGQWEGQVGFNVENILAAQVNPMGIANAFHKYGNMAVSVVDMSDITDLPNTVVCEILKLPCTNEGKVIGKANKKVMTLARRSNPTEVGFGDDEMSEVEEVLRMMDCYYYCDLRDNITILHGTDEMFTDKEGWKGCCETPEKFLSPAKAYAKLKSMGCRVLESTSTTVETMSKVHHEPEVEGVVETKPTSHEETVGAAKGKEETINKVVEEESATSSTVGSNDQSMDSSSFPCFALALFLAIIFFFFRYRRRRLFKEA